MAVTQYIGSRYVPIFADHVEWSSAKEYEPLTIVLHEGNSFTSKQFVPVGIDISNDAYWALSGNYNGQVERYRRDVAGVIDDISALSDSVDASIDGISAIIPASDFDSSNTVKSYIDSQIADSKIENYPKFSFPFFENQGDCELITYAGKSVLIDTGASTESGALQSLLSSNSVTRLDYLIITHYHNDHIGNIDWLVANNYIDSDTVIYLPPNGNYLTNYNVQAAAQGVINSLSGYNVVHTTQGLTFDVDDLSCLICNSSVVDYNTYFSNGQNYNDCSLVTLMTFKHAIHITNGDASSAVMYKMVNDGYLPTAKVGLYKVGHHGDNRASFSFANPLEVTNQAYQVLTKWKPSNVVQTGGRINNARNYHTQGYELSILSALGCDIYALEFNTSGVTFECDGIDFFAVNGHTSSIGSNAVAIRMYVDSSARNNTIQDGSSQHPFADLSQCLNTLVPNSNICYTINVAAGEYNKSHPLNGESMGDGANNFSGSNFNIRIVGTSAESVKIYNNINWINSYVWYENVTFVGSALYTGIPVNIYLYGCDAYFNGCVFTSAEDDNGYGYIYARRSDVCIESCTFDNYVNYAATGVQGSHYTVSYCTFNSDVAPLALNDGSSYSNGFDNVFTVDDLVKQSPNNNLGALMNTSITNPLIGATTDWNTVLNPGMYGINSTITDGVNAPASTIEQGVMLVLPHARNTTTLHRIIQLYIGVSGIYIRRRYTNNNFSNWVKLSV